MTPKGRSRPKHPALTDPQDRDGSADVHVLLSAVFAPTPDAADPLAVDVL